MRNHKRNTVKPTEEMVEAHAREQCKLHGRVADSSISYETFADGTKIAKFSPLLPTMPAWQFWYAEQSRQLLTAALADVSKLEKRLEHECTIEALRQRVQELENNAKSLRADKETLKHGLAQAHEELTIALKRVRELENDLKINKAV
jgi:ribosomal protein L9